MKKRATTPTFKGFATKSTLVAAAVVVAMSAPMSIAPIVSARNYQAEMDAIQRQIDGYQIEASKLSEQAKTLENQLAKLATEKSSIQARIDLSQKRHDKLQEDIKESEEKIVNNQDALGETIADMYVDDTISPLEMLASSTNIGDYVDKQAFRSSINDQLQSTIDEINKLKAELEQQKKDVERALLDQKSQRQQLVQKENERQSILSQTRGKEGAYQTLVKQNEAEMAKIRDAQAAYYRSLSPSVSVNAGDPNKGGYPYDHVGYYSYTADPWGMYMKQCVSYTAWKVYQKNGYMPSWGGKGNAWQWAFSGYHDGAGNKVNYRTSYYHTSNAQRYNIPSGSAPRVGSVGVRDASGAPGDQWGHVAWVERVDGDRIYISQYNWYNAGGPGWGHYSEMWVDSSFFQRYVYF